MIGGAEFRDGSDEGRRKVERSLEAARAAGLEDTVASSYLILVWSCTRLRLFADAGNYLKAALAHSDERGLDYWWLSLIACRAWCELGVGHWPDAEQSAELVLQQPTRSRVARVLALSVRGLVRARRGDGGVWDPLDEALKIAEPTAEIQQIAPAVAARAEAAWLEGRPERAMAAVAGALALAIRRDARREIGELACWSRRLGVDPGVTAAEPPYAALGCPYEAALALADGGDEAALRHAHDELQRLGAQPAAALVARRLRERGARGLKRGPRPATQANGANLTGREVEVVALVAEGLRNVDIAERLFLSKKTVDHHVSAILRKLGARTRGEAAAKAARLGIT